MILSGGIATTGPLSRSLFFFGYTEEQALVAKIKGKGLVVFTGCGHPKVNVIAQMVSRLSSEPVYIFGGGLHFPVTDGRGNRAGIKFQTILGTGKPPWQKITDTDLDETIGDLNQLKPKKVLLSAHDTCDYALEKFKQDLSADSSVLKAGETYTF
jgi:7,8-dihydropterin-6-yl-methyl-4-(beta-D-ribofuranosyl)aminobenzene 5'-phosphate synthase